MMTSTFDGFDGFFDYKTDIFDEYRLEGQEINKFYDDIEKFLADCQNNSSLLELGCRTGLELERVFHL